MIGWARVKRKPPLTAGRSCVLLCGGLAYLTLFAAMWKVLPAYETLARAEQLLVANLTLLVALHLVLAIAGACGLLVHATLGVQDVFMRRSRNR